MASAFDGLRENLIVGLIAAIALSASLALIALPAPHYLRGEYLEGELRLAKRVQSDLQPKPHSVSPHLEFAASAIAADLVGGDLYDVFEMEPVQIAESDSLVLYSDGISEATERNDQKFGEYRIKGIVAEHNRDAAAEICGRIMDRVTAFASTEAAADDRTLMVVKFLSPRVDCLISKHIVEEAAA